MSRHAGARRVGFAYVDQAELPPGWLRVLTDERLRPAIGLMHADPGKPWSLDELARAAAMSRTSFAERFRTVGQRLRRHEPALDRVP